MMNDFTSVSMDLNSINKYLNDNGAEISAEDRAILNSIFKECDTENAKREYRPDGKLSSKERYNFLKRLESALPKLYQKLLAFSRVVETEEEIEAIKKEAFERLEEERAKQKREELEKNIHFGLDS